MKSRILLILLAVLCALSMASCNDDSIDTDASSDTNQDVTANYKVTVLNEDGTPLADYVVNFGDQIAFTNAEGIATMTLTGSEFAIKVTDLAKKEYFIGENVVVTPENNEITVTVCNNSSELPYERVHDSGTPDNIDDDRCAYLVSEAGKYYTPNASGEEMIFFLFTATQDGIYKFSIDVEGEVGYYGAPLNALHAPIAPLPDADGAVTIEIKKNNLATDDTQATPYLLGVKLNDTSTSSFMLEIKRLGDPVYTPADDPYTYITNPAKLDSLFISYKNWEIVTADIDISKTHISLVYNNDDKCYHLNDENGPVVYVKVGTESKYLPSFYKVCETSLMSSYIYDDDGNYLSKEAYNGLINQYYELCDKSTGLYPLDKYMERAIKNHGNSAGWWNSSSPMYLFGSDEINVDNAWLFACCTIEVKKDTIGTQSTPIEVEKSIPSDIVTEKILADKEGSYCFSYISGIDATLKIENAQGIKVVCNGTEYEANNGKIVVSLSGTINTFEIVNTTDEEMEISFTIS